jgi:hypothetical protein
VSSPGSTFLERPSCAKGTRWRPYDNGVRRNVSRHHRPRADKGAYSNSDTAQDDGAGTYRRFVVDDRPLELPVFLGLQQPSAAGRARPSIIDEHDPVSNEDAVTDFHAPADEGVALDFAGGADGGTALDLNERAYARVITDPATVEVREGVDENLVPELNPVDEPVGRLVRWSVSHAQRRRGCPRQRASSVAR